MNATAEMQWLLRNSGMGQYTAPERRRNLSGDRDNGQQYLRGVRGIVKYSNIRFFHLCAVHLRISTLEVA
jgi:hypothetical protein